jgi:hypothetical protein
MGADHPLRDRQAHLATSSLRFAVPADCHSPLENALQADETSLWDSAHTKDVNSLIDEMPGFEGLWFSYRTSS